jgi:hypothetical protein
LFNDVVPFNIRNGFQQFTATVHSPALSAPGQFILHRLCIFFVNSLVLKTAQTITAGKLSVTSMPTGRSLAKVNVQHVINEPARCISSARNFKPGDSITEAILRRKTLTLEKKLHCFDIRRI